MAQQLRQRVINALSPYLASGDAQVVATLDRAVQVSADIKRGWFATKVQAPVKVLPIRTVLNPLEMGCHQLVGALQVRAAALRMTPEQVRCALISQGISASHSGNAPVVNVAPDWQSWTKDVLQRWQPYCPSAASLTSFSQQYPAYRVPDDLLPSDFRNRRVVVEFSSPNIAKPFHVGHMRSTLVGHAVARLRAAAGQNVVKLNYLGDWGRQFGLVLLGLEAEQNNNVHGCSGAAPQSTAQRASSLQRFYDAYTKAASLCDSDPEFLAEAQAKARDLEAALLAPGASALEDSNPNSMDSSVLLQQWKSVRHDSLAAYKVAYRRLQVDFDAFDGEAAHVAAAQSLLRKLDQQRWTRRESNGALIGDPILSREIPAFVLQKADGSSTYLTRDVAAAIHRFSRFQADELVYVAGQQQELHFRQVAASLHAMGAEHAASAMRHVGFGLVKGMSTRRGNVVFMDDVLDEAARHMTAILSRNPRKAEGIQDPEATTRMLALSAVAVQDLRVKRTKDYAFHWQRMLASEGDTGTFLQYTHARLCSLELRLELADNITPLSNIDPTLCAPEFQDSDVAQRLLFEIGRFDTSAAHACLHDEPSVVVQSALRVARATGAALSQLRVLEAPTESARGARSALFAAARCAVAAGLQLAGLTPLPRV